MTEWKEYKLGEIAEIVGGGTPDTSNKEYWGGNIPWLTPKDLTGYNKIFISSGERFITEEGLDNSSTKLLPQGTVLLSSRAPIGYVAIASNPICTNQGFKSIICNKDIVDNLYMYYWIKNNTELLQSLGTGTTFAEISGSVVKSIDISLPPLPEQIRIASILSSLDDKIDLLHRENKTLEAMAETLFRQWFIEEAKEDWKEGKLEDMIEIKYGKDHKKLEDGKIPVIGSGGIMRYANTSLYDKESVLIPRKGSLNNVMYINKPFWTVDTMFYTKMLKPNTAKFVYHFMKGLDLANMNVGSAVPSMTTEVLNNIPIDIPPQDVFDKFENHVGNLYRKMEDNNKQIQTLIQQRDSLLPKLMSGEVKI